MQAISSAYEGWCRYTDAGKYAVLFLAAALFLVFRHREKKERLHSLLCYGLVAAVLAICPLTAAVWMQYQTQFYDYEWIWSAVPVTPVIAWGLTELWAFLKERKTVIFCAALVAAVLCGSLGTGLQGRAIHSAGEEKAQAVLDKLSETGNTETVCLWAPKELLQYVRGLDGSATVLYGRNMWEGALNAYSYDTYSDAEKVLYLWMEELVYRESSPAKQAEVREMAAEQVAIALQHGANCIAVPSEYADTVEAALQELMQADFVKVLETEEYRIFLTTAQP